MLIPALPPQFAAVPLTSGAPGTVFAEAPNRAAEAAGWLERNWEGWLAAGLRILLIGVLAFVIQKLVRRTITRVISRMGRRERPGTSRSLLVNPERRQQRLAAIGSVLRSMATLMVLGTAALMVLDQLGIQLGPLVASAGIVGVAIGFGARNLVTDVLTGMFMLLEDQYGVGDRIDAGEVTGTVLEIGLRVTTLRADDGEVWFVRNGEIRRVGNLSQGWSTATLEVEVRSSQDPDRVAEVLAAAGERLSLTPPWDELLWEPLEVLGLESVSLDSQVVKATVKVPPGKAKVVERELRRLARQALAEAGIEQVDAAGLTLEKLLPGPRDTAPAAGESAGGPAAGPRRPGRRG